MLKTEPGPTRIGRAGPRSCARAPRRRSRAHGQGRQWQLRWRKSAQRSTKPRSSIASRSRSSRYPARARSSGRPRPLRGPRGDAARPQPRYGDRHRRALAAQRAQAFAIASAFGRGSRLSLEVLNELRLLLRWFRFKRLHADYANVLAALCDAPILIAAVSVGIEAKRSGRSNRARMLPFRWIKHNETSDDTNVG